MKQELTSASHFKIHKMHSCHTNDGHHVAVCINVQACDLIFVVSFLVKCVARKETRKVSTFSSGALSGEVICDKGTGAAAG